MNPQTSQMPPKLEPCLRLRIHVVPGWNLSSVASSKEKSGTLLLPPKFYIDMALEGVVQAPGLGFLIVITL